MPDTKVTRETTSQALQEALERQRSYENQRATVLGRGAERLTAPLGSLIARFVPPGLVRAGLRAADRVAGITVPKEITSHDPDNLEACERAALRVQKWAMGSNAATGGAAGWFGVAGVSADIPATIALAARNVRATAAAYGFTGDSPEERAFRLMVLEVATAGAGEGRADTLGNLNRMAEALNSPEAKIVMEKGGEWLSEKVVERIARQLGVTLSTRKAGQIVPIVGGAVGAVVNASFQTDVSRAARYAYTQRWLMARRALAKPEGTS